MAISVVGAEGKVTVELSGWDRLMTGCRSVEVDLAAVRSTAVEPRGTLEAGIDHRVSGIGTHDGARRPGRRRVGTMLGRALGGRQFWAVSTGAATDRLLVIDLAAGPFARVVVDATQEIEALLSSAVRAR